MNRRTMPYTLQARVDEDLYREIMARARASSESSVLRQALRLYLAVLRELEERRP